MSMIDLVCPDCLRLRGPIHWLHILARRCPRTWR